MRVAVVVGTRPEAIKLAPVAKALRAKAGLDVRVVATAQQREMLDQAFAEMDLAPDIDLDLMRPAQTLADYAGRAVMALGALFAAEAPAYVIGQGDTTTAFAAAMAASYARIDFGHVEAGLRSGVPDRPFPEEMNRRLISLVARHHFCPTALARANLMREGIVPDAIHVTGNPGIDALLTTDAALRGGGQDPGRRSILVTVHRRENIATLPAILAAVLHLLDLFPDVVIRWPVHRNPDVSGRIQAGLAGHTRVLLTAPLGHREFVRAMREATVILTDSGGVQEEAPALGIPVLVLRDETERPEGVAAGVARLVGSRPDRIVAAATELLADPQVHARMARGASPYGDGRASARIADIVHRHLSDGLPLSLRTVRF